MYEMLDYEQQQLVNQYRLTDVSAINHCRDVNSCIVLLIQSSFTQNTLKHSIIYIRQSLCYSK